MLQIKEFTSINSVSGNETAMREKIISEILPYADSITTDTMGNVIALKKGTNTTGKKVVMSAHMDEVGFIVSDITDDGYVKFKSVGSIDERIMLAQRVVIGKKNIAGVIGIKAVHLQTSEERKNIIKEKDMYIDIGAADKKEAQSMVEKGDYVSFASQYCELGDGVIKAKALDDRVGCAVLTELIKGRYENDIYFCFCVQEEVGLRGASVIAKRLCADVAVVLESTTSSDVPKMKKHLFSSCLGGGPVISIMDKGSYSDVTLNDFIVSLAQKNSIAFQYKKSAYGGNDAGAYQTSSLACKTAVISLPCRYIHSPVSCAKREDMDLMYALSKEVARNIHTYIDMYIK